MRAERGARHARRGRRAGWTICAAAAAVLLVGAGVAMTSAVASPDAAAEPSPTASASQTPPAIASTPRPAAAVVDACALPGVTDALASGDDAAVIDAMGGAAAMREAVLTGSAPCVDLADPARVWMVVDKTRPYRPRDYVPESLARVQDMRVINAGVLRTDAGAALSEMVAAARAAGAGQIAITSGYRSFGDQKTQYASQVSAKGRTGADEVSARPGFSEHQSGLATDVVACDGGCSSIEKFGRTSQGKWVAANAWRYGFVVRYEKGQTGTTGYSPEPWHLRYVGIAIAEAYHEGGFRTLEEFWGLPASPDYGD